MVLVPRLHQLLPPTHATPIWIHYTIFTMRQHLVIELSWLSLLYLALLRFFSFKSVLISCPAEANRLSLFVNPHQLTTPCPSLPTTHFMPECPDPSLSLSPTAFGLFLHLILDGVFFPSGITGHLGLPLLIDIYTWASVRLSGIAWAPQSFLCICRTDLTDLESLLFGWI